MRSEISSRRHCLSPGVALISASCLVGSWPVQALAQPPSTSPQVEADASASDHQPAAVTPAGDTPPPAPQSQTKPPLSAVNALHLANDPLTDLSAFQVQTYYQPVLKNGNGAQTIQPFLRGVIPFQAFGRTNLMRISMPAATYAWNSQASAAGLGDLTIFNIPIFELGETRIGVGPLVVLPTATSPEFGLQKWQLGGQAVISKPYPWGMLAALVGYQQTVDGLGKDLVVQPFIFRHLGNGFYLRSTAISSFNFSSQSTVVPIGLGIGRVTRLASGNLLNVFLEPQISAVASGADQPVVQVFAGFNLQFLANR